MILELIKKRNLVLGLISELRTMDLASILFSSLLFYFPFIFSYPIENKMKKTKCDTITGHMSWSQKSHDYVIQKRAHISHNLMA